ncbi:2987_t:CDS:2 [Scutellospora calospora]|uniref:2987_t:CDS:1 n=1 Tax=Scutellospora calospora TaxID=85575 RepID=A0ACA9L612_9GLOM|nr:2987_t:CDS:2 [Scutellospora calospora]
MASSLIRSVFKLRTIINSNIHCDKCIFIKSAIVNSNRSFETNATNTNSHDNIFYKKFDIQNDESLHFKEHRINALSAEKIIDNRFKFLKENIYNHVNYELLEDFPKWFKELHMQNLTHYFKEKT